MGNGEWSTEQDDFPILALECSPCEFVISSHLEPEYSADAFESKNNSPTIDIKVRNLRVFWANGLMQRVQYVWELQKPSDFTELYDGAGEVYDGAGSLASATNWRFEWMKRMFMLPDEYGVYSYDVNPAATTHYFSDYNDMMHPDTLRPDAAILDLPIDSTWHRATVSDEAYVIRNFKDLWGAFKSIITSNTTLIRDSRVPDRYYFRNDLMRLDYRTYEYYVRHNYAQIDVEGMHNAVRMRILNLLNQLKDFGIVDTGKPGSQQEMTPIINNTEKQEGVIQYGLVGEDIPD